MGNSYLDSKLMWKRKRFTQSTKYDLRSFGAFSMVVISSGSCEEIDGDGPDKELLLTGGCG
jgi:hypothetical protein